MILGAFAVPHPPIILKEVGKGEEKKIQKTLDSYRSIGEKIKELNPETIVIISPHTAIYSDYFHISPGKKAKGNLKNFGVSDYELEVEYDEEFVNKLSLIGEENEIPAGTLGEVDKDIDHGTLVPLYFLEETGKKYKIVRMGYSGFSRIDHYNMGKAIKETANRLNRKTVVIGSGDLSHKLKESGPYGFIEEGPIFDKEIVEIFKTGDFSRLLNMNREIAEKAAECGLKSFIVMAGSLDKKEIEPKFYSYEDTFGVGYGIASFIVIGDNEENAYDKDYENIKINELKEIRAKESEPVRLARLALEKFVKTGEKAELPEEVSDELIDKKSGVFVTLNKEGELRGCIGTIEGVQKNIAEEIMSNAISSGTRDFRFYPVTVEELDDLVYSVDILGEAEKINSINELNVDKYGVIVSAGSKRGLLLPMIDSVDTPSKQLSIALEKAGIRPNEDYIMERFEVVRYK